MDFLYPIPEAIHPRLSEIPEDGRRFAIRRGFVIGFVDLVFEHQGLVYFGDWKSNCLAGFDAQHVTEEVERDYALQARLYTLALVKMLGVHDAQSYDARFGGLLFLFLRGLKRDGSEGVYFQRPGWRDVVGWEEELRALDLHGGEP
jgi:exodeoxyribonuclease V beta subunit